jgi:flagellum-specific peptidoglycan hydrolase FlgJ
MKKILQGILCVLLLMFVPIHFSNTSEMIMTEQEKEVLKEMVRTQKLTNQIEKEYDLFYSHLISLNNSCFVDEFFERVMGPAIESKSLPSVAIAQAAIETGYGRSNKLKNNIFGIKGKGIRASTYEVYNGRWVKIIANFQYFPTLTDAFNKHSEILHRYGAFGYDYEFWINRIVARGYATDPRYQYKIRFVIDKYQLHRLDKIQMLKNKIKNKEICNLVVPSFV